MAKTLLTVLLVPLLALPVTAEAAPPRDPAAPYPVTPFHPKASDNDRLERAWTVWQARTDRRHYLVEVSTGCFCPPGRKPIVTEVKGRRVVSVTRKGGSTQLRRRGNEVPSLYRLVRDAYADADRVEVTWRRGVPVRIYVDGDTRIADDEISYSVTLNTPSPDRPTARHR